MLTFLGDENGLFPNETTANLPPAPVAHAQAAEASFVRAWLKDFKSSSTTENGSGKGKGEAAPSPTKGAAATSSGAANSVFTPASDVLPLAIIAAITTLGVTFGTGLTFIRNTVFA